MLKIEVEFSRLLQKIWILQKFSDFYCFEHKLYTSILCATVYYMIYFSSSMHIVTWPLYNSVIMVIILQSFFSLHFLFKLFMQNCCTKLYKNWLSNQISQVGGKKVKLPFGNMEGFVVYCTIWQSCRFAYCKK